VSPKLTVGLPVFNGERHLREAIESILAQSFGDFRLLVADNASTDGTQEIVRGYAARDGRIRYHRNEANIGLAANFNLVFRMSDTPYFRWATSDDVSLPDYLKRCVECLDRESDVVLAYTKTRFIDAEGKPLDRQDRGLDLASSDPAERFRQILEAGSWVNAILGVMRSDVLAKTALLPSYSSGDYGLLGELCLLGKFRELPECLFLRRFARAVVEPTRATGRLDGTVLEGGARVRSAHPCGIVVVITSRPSCGLRSRSGRSSRSPADSRER
jgi:glycosyltransferase involved in cell wall biosynthesis